MGEMRKEALDGVVLFWIFTNKTYDKLRTLQGCENLGDLAATTTDVKHIRRMARSMGARKIFEDEEETIKTVKATEKKLVAECKKISAEEGKRITLIVYCGGHGASHKERQIYLFNGTKASDVCY